MADGSVFVFLGSCWIICLTIQCRVGTLSPRVSAQLETEISHVGRQSLWVHTLGTMAQASFSGWPYCMLTATLLRRKKSVIHDSLGNRQPETPRFELPRTPSRALPLVHFSLDLQL